MRTRIVRTLRSLAHKIDAHPPHAHARSSVIFVWDSNKGKYVPEAVS